MATNIIGYKDRDNLSTNATVTIYTCSNKSEPTLESNMLSIKKEDKTFIVQVNDRAWIDFAKNLIIE